MGVYEKVDQSIPVTRYHSLAGTFETLPSCLEVTSWTVDKGVIQGVRHKEYVLEGVQYHPESILTLTGRYLFRNFLKWKGGKWSDMDKDLIGNVGKSTAYSDWRKLRSDGNSNNTEQNKPSKLEEIYTNRRKQVAAQKLIPGQRPSDLQTLHDLMIAPPLIDFVDRVKSSPYKMALMAEIKRASPSKGIIDIDANSAVQARRYALADAAVISVLTEPTWFKGSLEDLRAARQSVEGLVNRPAILRKEFIFDEYQILEGRLAGADTVLLIVKMLPEELLTRLYRYSQSLGMEPLVEVSCAEEMEAALRLNAKVIGVNNRDLHSFKVDLGTTTSLVSQTPEGTILCALSGISTREDVERYEDAGVSAVLIGESLMRAGHDAKSFIDTLMGEKLAGLAEKQTSRAPLVKICGTRTVKAAQTAAEAGADMVGIILVQGSKRCVEFETAKQISDILHSTSKGGQAGKGESNGVNGDQKTATTKIEQLAQDYFQHHLSHSLVHPRRTLLVGVFQNQPLSYILHAQQVLGLDIIQLHGREPLEYAHLIPVPVIKAFKPLEAGLSTRGYHAVPLLDAGSGGSGQKLDIAGVRSVLESGVDVMLAGGLDPDCVREVVKSFENIRRGLGGVDVSSGIETDSKQDLDKIVRFIKEAKSAL